MLSVGLIGLGTIGRVHARNIAANPEMRLAAVFDPVATRTREFADAFGARGATRLEEILEAKDIDAVVVGSSTNTHSDIATRAARAGKSVYCEKPLDLSLDKALATAEAIRPTGVPVMMGFNRRFDESHAALHHAVKDGGVGRVQLVQMTSRGPNAVPTDDYIRASGGFYRDKGVHFFDLLRFITADEVAEVSTMGAALSDPAIGALGDIDTFIVNLRMKSGALAQIDNARRANYGYDERLEVFGTGGLVESGRTPRRMVTRSSGDGFLSEGLHANIFERFGHTYYSAMAAFGRFVSGREGSIPSLDDGIAAQIIAEAAVIAARETRTVAIAEVIGGARGA
jgi:myo-inositol 2-dehydrogenase/D-chiro-inositol 1-dehydrogenase